MARSWVIGSRPECDLMVDRPTVSGRHCRLQEDDGGFTLEDLGSSNGTFVNGSRIPANAGVRVTRRDAVTLGPSVPLPWPPELAPPGARTLRIGREPDNDVVLNSPMVSGHHARVVWEGPPAEPLIEDLGSSNGTALGSPDRKTPRAVISPADTVFLGTHPVAATQLLWQLDPALVPTLAFRGRPVVIGRNSDCDQVFDLPMVSGRHARLVRSEGQTWIEDLNSSNGTFVNGQKVDRAPLRRGDLISLGTYLVVFDGEPGAGPAPAARAERAAAQVVTSAPTPPPLATARPAPPPPAAEAPGGLPAGSWAGAFAGQLAAVFRHPWRLVALLAQAPLLALLIVLVLRVGPDGPSLTPEGWTPPAQTLAAVLFWLGLAAVWFGLSSGVLGPPAHALDAPNEGTTAGTARLAARFVALGALGLLQCVVAWLLVAGGAGLKGPAVPMLALLVTASAVGLALGLAVAALVPRPELGWAALPLVMLPLWLFGGEFRPLPAMAAWARPVSGLLPSRWAFEGLLLLEAEGYPWRVTQTPAAPDAGAPWNNDLAERYFPAETERMGVGADTTALAAMLVGLAALAFFLAGGPRPAPSTAP
jgi:pSer/pThr/pTyr-binding forkhead associated (FHA) protein